MILSVFRGVISLLLYILNMLVHAALILLTVALLFLIPVKSWRASMNRRFLQPLPASFDYFNYLISRISTKNKWDIAGSGNLSDDAWYVMISNHRSWLDILVLGIVFNRKIPSLKFFMKKELLWQLPLAGLACYALGYPFMSRHSPAEIKKNPHLKGRDAETTKKACERLRFNPSTIINFIEGTRFTIAKKERQQSPFEHLLKPRAGGAAVVIQELPDILAGILDVTIHYAVKMPTIWNFACGNFDKIVIRFELLLITPDLIGDYNNDRQFRAYFQQWLNIVWQRKDALLTELTRSDQKTP